MKSLNKTVFHLCWSGVSTYPINNTFLGLMTSKGLLNTVKSGVGFKKRVKLLEKTSPANEASFWAYTQKQICLQGCK